MTEKRYALEKQLYPLYHFYINHKDVFQTQDDNFKDQKKIRIFQGEDFIKFTTTYSEEITNLIPDKKQDAISIAKYLIENGIIVKIDKLASDRKWQDSKDQNFTCEAFYTWNLQMQNEYNYLILILLVLISIALSNCLHFKYYFIVQIMLLFTIVFLINLYIMRFTVYLISRLLGNCFWIFPNLNKDCNGIIGSFKPLYSNHKFRDGKLRISLRLISIIAFIFLIYTMVKGLSEFIDEVEKHPCDSLDWDREYQKRRLQTQYPSTIQDHSELITQTQEDLSNLQINNIEDNFDIRQDSNIKMHQKELLKHEEIDQGEFSSQNESKI